MTTKSPPLILAVDDSAKMHKILQAKLKSEIANVQYKMGKPGPCSILTGKCAIINY